MSISTTLAAATFNLVTFICSDGTMTDCEIYTRENLTTIQCEAAATEIGERARKLQLPDTVVFYCTEDLSEIDQLINDSLSEGENK